MVEESVDISVPVVRDPLTNLLFSTASTTATVTAEPVAPKATGVTRMIVHGSGIAGAEAVLAAATVIESEYQPTDDAVLVLQDGAGQDAAANGILSGPGIWALGKAFAPGVCHLGLGQQASPAALSMAEGMLFPSKLCPGRDGARTAS